MMRKFQLQLMKRVKIALLSVVFAGSICLIAVPARVLAINGTAITALTNNQRATVGLSPLLWNSALSNSARAKANDLCAKAYWAHTSPDGTEPWTLMERAGYLYINAGENLAKGFGTDEAVVAGWMASPGHRANILKPAFTEVGVAYSTCTLDGVQTTVVVSHYGSPQQAPTPPAPKPVTPVAKPASTPTKPAPVAATSVNKVEVQPDVKQHVMTVLNAPQDTQDKKVKKNFFSEIWSLRVVFSSNIFKLHAVTN